MLKTVLGQGEKPLTGKEGELSEKLWNLLGFQEVLPLLDAYVPKLDKSGKSR
jgi:hypothetical protein